MNDESSLEQFWNPTEPNESEGSYRKLLAAAENGPTPDRSYLADLYSRIARAEAAQMKLKDAHASLKKAEHLLHQPGAAPRVSATILWHLETGRLEVLEKTPSQARSHLVIAWELATDSGEDDLAVQIALMMSAIEPQKQQQDWIIRAIGLAEDSPNQHVKRWLGSLYTALGWKQYDLRQFETALKTFEKAFGHLQIHGTRREVFVAKWSIGKVLRIMGRTELALGIQNDLLTELRAGGAGGAGIAGGSRGGRLFEELAECLHILKRTAEAQPYFELAYRELSTDTWVVDNQPVLLKRLKDLGKVK
ncbi:MAG TPA: hypothetical protein VJB59_04655 [Bdellovibrionota bacterium]|nr:hypothetical protein [Bdellovibrionota bacterium]